MKPPFFDSREMPPPTIEYVAWVDVMGVRAVMARSLPATANFVFKLHVVMLEERTDRIRLYPVMDDAYVTSPSNDAIRAFLSDVFARLTDVFVEAESPLHQCVIKGAVAFGPVVHGHSLPASVGYTLDNNRDYRESILLGLPMVQAVQSELKAPPFGVFVHESARSFAPTGKRPFNNVWWNWFHPNHRKLAERLKPALESYYNWYEARSAPLEYDSDRIEKHREMVRQYFVDFEGAA